jgi:hypothetical protein
MQLGKLVEPISLVISDTCVDASWVQTALALAGSTVVSVSLEFLCSFAEGVRRVDMISKAASEYEDRTKEPGHAWYGADRAAVKSFRQRLHVAFESYLLRQANDRQQTTILCPDCSLDDRRLVGLVTWMKDTWATVRVVLATAGPEATGRPDQADVLGDILLATQNSSEVWLVDGMSLDEARGFLANWLKEAR